MRTDRELLELAAKAAGIELKWMTIVNGPQAGEVFCSNWHPWADDGDALRLACDLGLRVYPIARTETGAACSAVGDVTGKRMSEVADMLPTRAATRRAIVIAAAEIGASMP